MTTRLKLGVCLTCQGAFFEQLKSLEDLDVEVIFRANFQLFQEGAPFPEEWQHVDAFIFQPVVNPPSDYYSDANLLANHVSHQATVIRAPYIMYTGQYPWYCGKEQNEARTAYGISWVDDNLESFKAGELGVDDVLEWTNCDILKYHEMSLRLLREKEAECDIRGFADYIEENIRDHSLFWTPNHPRGDLASLLCSQALALLGIELSPKRLATILDSVLTPERSPVLPCVRRALGIHHRTDLAYFLGDELPLPVRSYVSEYIDRRISQTDVPTDKLTS